MTGHLLIKIVALFVSAAVGLHQHHHHRPLAVKTYAHKLAKRHGWTGYQWRDLNEIVTGESHWDPCAVNPRKHNCGYQGSNSCGIPQKDPCPARWQGRLWVTRYEQVRILISYIEERYGTPANALAFHIAHGWY